jgi:hypothetical protein
MQARLFQTTAGEERENRGIRLQAASEAAATDQAIRKKKQPMEYIKV